MPPPGPVSPTAQEPPLAQLAVAPVVVGAMVVDVVDVVVATTFEDVVVGFAA